MITDNERRQIIEAVETYKTMVTNYSDNYLNELLLKLSKHDFTGTFTMLPFLTQMKNLHEEWILMIGAQHEAQDIIDN